MRDQNRIREGGLGGEGEESRERVREGERETEGVREEVRETEGV